MSSFPLMSVYTVVALALQAVAIGIVVLIEPFIDGWSASIYMALFLLAFWAAWVIAVRLTDPKTADINSAQPVKA
jgi:cyanate permease